MKKILVCMPTYHSPPEWIHRAVASLKKQTHCEFDCWIVKDGCRKAATFTPNSTENICLECERCRETCLVCDEITANDARFCFFTMPINFSGAGWGPRDFIIMNTQHELIAYLDDDNWYEPEHLSELYKTITANNTDMVYTGTRLFNQKMELVTERIHAEKPKKGGIDTSEIMHKRDLIFRYGGWRYVKKGCDWDLVDRWMQNGVTWSHTNKLTLNFYLRKGCGIHRT